MSECEHENITHGFACNFTSGYEFAQCVDCGERVEFKTDAHGRTGEVKRIPAAEKGGGK